VPSNSGLRRGIEHRANLTLQPVHSREGFDPRNMSARRRLRPKSKAAPSTSYPIQRSPSMGYGLLGAWCLAVFVSVCWVLTPSFGAGHTGPARTGVLVSLVLSAGAAYWGWVHVQPGLLRWDGKVWRIEELNGATNLQPAAVFRLRVQLDFQFLLLLSLQAVSVPATSPASGKAGGRGRWIWLDQSSQRRQWPALRRAVFSPKPPRSTPIQRDAALNTEGVV
jgi:hypothetical protein